MVKQIKKARIEKRVNRKQSLKKFFDSNCTDEQSFFNACKGDENLLIYTCLTKEEREVYFEKLRELEDTPAKIDYLLTNQPFANETVERYDRVTKAIAKYLKGYIEYNGFRMSNAEGKACTTLNGALGGFGEGRKRLQKILKEFFTDLRKAGFGIFCIGHTKVKTIKEKGDETEGYNILSSTLSNDYESIFADIFDVILTGTIEKAVDGKKVVGEERRLYFRSTGYIDAGCRFAPDAVPEYIVYEGNFARTLLDTLEEGLRKSKTNPVSKAEFKKEQAKEVKELENKHLDKPEEEQEPKLNKVEAVNTIKANISKLNFADVQNVMKKHGFANFNNPDEIPEEGLLEILKMIK